MSGPTPFDRAAAAVAGGADPVAEARGLVGLMTPAERRWCLDGDQPCWAGLAAMARGDYHRRSFLAARVERLGIPGFAFTDGPRGLTTGPATAFPVSMARGATWDVELEERIGEAIGTELRAVDANLFGGVCVNVLRHPAWGRAQETYGEDPFLVGEMGAALARGVQRHAMACVKHFAVNSMENARFTVDVTVDEVALHEVFLPHFRRVVEEGVACVMTAYNSMNGEWCGQNRELITEILRDEWGFEGIVISDWIFGLRDAAKSVLAGLDVEMPFPMVRAQHLDAALADGTVTEDDVATIATRVVATLLRWWSVVSRPPPPIDVLASPEHRALAREAAAASIVLLRNEPVDGGPALPLDPAGLSRLAVVGRLAAVRNLGDGGSSDVWAPSAVTPLDGLRAALGADRREGPGAGAAVEVVHDDGADPASAAAVAASADAAVVVVGYTKDDEGEFIGATSKELTALLPGPDDPELAAEFEARLAAEGDRGWENPNPAAEAGGFATGGDRTSLRLHPADEDLIAAVAAACPRTVVVVMAGSAVLVEAWFSSVPAIVATWYPGMEGGHALADVLLGRGEPVGRLPFTVPTDEAHLPPFDRDAEAVVYDSWHGYWRLARDGHAARYPFGFGLSYTDLSIDGATAAIEAPGGSQVPADGGDPAAGHLVVAATVSNRGARAGVEVVQVYAAAEGSPPRLAGFARVPLRPDESSTAEVRVPLGRLARRDPSAHHWVPAAGPHLVVVARHAQDPDAHELHVDLG